MFTCLYLIRIILEVIHAGHLMIVVYFVWKEFRIRIKQ